MALHVVLRDVPLVMSFITMWHIIEDAFLLKSKTSRFKTDAPMKIGKREGPYHAREEVARSATTREDLHATPASLSGPKSNKIGMANCVILSDNRVGHRKSSER